MNSQDGGNAVEVLDLQVRLEEGDDAAAGILSSGVVVAHALDAENLQERIAAVMVHEGVAVASGYSFTSWGARARSKACCS